MASDISWVEFTTRPDKENADEFIAANRAASYRGQLAGIAVNGLMETLTGEAPMTAPNYLADFKPDLDAATTAAQVVADFATKYSWFIPWFIPTEYHSELGELGQLTAKSGRLLPAHA